MKLYTIGFTKKTAEDFFYILKKNNVEYLLDVRLNNSSQLSGFTKGSDLKYFLKELLEIRYIHDIDLAPTKDILANYKKNKITWKDYETQFLELLNKRDILNKILNMFPNGMDGVCLLCSESTPEKCHRRLVAEYIKNNFNTYNIEVMHL